MARFNRGCVMSLDPMDNITDDEIEVHRLALTKFGEHKPTMREVLAYADKHNLNGRAQKPTNKATWARKKRRPKRGSDGLTKIEREAFVVNFSSGTGRTPTDEQIQRARERAAVSRNPFSKEESELIRGWSNNKRGGGSYETNEP